MKLCLCIQYYEGDILQAEALARFIAEIEPESRKDVVIRFVARYDSPHLDMDVFKVVSKKFDVSWVHSRRKWKGWPDGPNGMALDILEDGTRALENAGWYDVDGLVLLEPDCVPLANDWLNMLKAEWQVALSQEKWIMGSWRGSGPECGHINGNCVVRPDLAKKISLLHPAMGLAWDCWLAPRLKNHWHITGLIRNDFQSRNATEAILRTPEVGDRPPVLVHGYKDQTAMDIARKQLL